MSLVEARVPAVGGGRTVPPPDPIARDYLLLALRLDQHVPGLVDGYFGPASLKAEIDLEQGRSPGRLRDDAAGLLARVAAELEPGDRRTWLTAQLRALERQAAELAGERLPYVEHVARCFDWAPERRDDATFDHAAAELDMLLPGPGPVADRLVAFDAELEIPFDRLSEVVDWLVPGFRERARPLFGLPEGEDLRVTLVRDQPWSGYDWYDGGLRSRVDINTDLPVRAYDLLRTLAHETYPGHHLEHAWKEADLVERQGRLEASVLLINTPECLISEGLADLGRDFALPADGLVELLVEVFDRADLPVAADAGRARETAQLAAAIAGPRFELAATRVNAALLRHAEGASHEETLEYLVQVGRYPPAVAQKRLEFIEHPLWRTYVFVYSEGEALLRRWLGMVPDRERPGRFARLLHEQLTPGSIAAELRTAPAGATEPSR